MGFKKARQERNEKDHEEFNGYKRKLFFLFDVFFRSFD